MNFSKAKPFLLCFTIFLSLALSLASLNVLPFASFVSCIP